MSLFPITGGRVALTTQTTSADQYQNGIRISNNAAVVATSGGDEYNNGLLESTTGAVIYADASSGLPANTQWTNGLPLSSAGALLTSTNQPSTYSNGIPFDSAGAIAASISTFQLDFTTQSLDSRITYTGQNGTYFDSTGILRAASTNQARFTTDPVTGYSGLLVEEARTNLLLNSLLNGTNLSTQTITVAAVAHTLSFTGTGTVTLSGVSTAGPLVGTGANNRVTLTFTPTAGSLTLTVSGNVKWANLEAGSFATSFIPTAGASVTRAADVAVMTGTNFSSWYNASEGTFVVDFMVNYAPVSGTLPTALSADDSTGNERMQIRRNDAAGSVSAVIVDGGVVQFNQGVIGAVTLPANTVTRATLSYKLNDCSIAQDGMIGATDTAATIPTVNRLLIGNGPSANYVNGIIGRITFYPTRLANATLQALSA